MVITSSSVPTPWNGAFVRKGKFVDKFKIVRKEHDEVADIYEVVVEFYASPGQEYVFEVSPEVYASDKEVIGEEILKQLKSD